MASGTRAASSKSQSIRKRRRLKSFGYLGTSTGNPDSLLAGRETTVPEQLQ